MLKKDLYEEIEGDEVWGNLKIREFKEFRSRSNGGRKRERKDLRDERNWRKVEKEKWEDEWWSIWGKEKLKEEVNGNIGIEMKGEDEWIGGKDWGKVRCEEWKKREGMWKGEREMGGLKEKFGDEIKCWGDGCKRKLKSGVEIGDMIVMGEVRIDEGEIEGDGEIEKKKEKEWMWRM